MSNEKSVFKFRAQIVEPLQTDESARTSAKQVEELAQNCVEKANVFSF